MRRRGPFVAVALLAAVGLAACGGSSNSGAAGGSSPASAASPTSQGGSSHPNLSGQSITFVFDNTPEASSEPELHGIDVLKSWGASVHLSFDPSTATSFAQMEHGGSFMGVGMTAGVSGVESGLPLVAVALAEPRQDYVFICRPNVSSLSQLKGKTIGVEDTTGLNYAQAIIALQAGGLNVSDVHLIADGGQSERLAALIAGRTDCTMLSHVAALTTAGKGYHVLYDFTKQQANLYDDMWWSTKSYVSSHPQVVLALNEATLESLAWLSNPANNAAAAQEVLKYDPAADVNKDERLFQMLRQANAWAPGSIMTVSALQSQEHLYVNAKAIPSYIPVSQWADVSFGQQALQKVGTSSS
jgi:ABC-type nitrate/sulfonate/bicarbonate transport system substrate-binding protein